MDLRPTQPRRWRLAHPRQHRHRPAAAGGRRRLAGRGWLAVAALVAGCSAEAPGVVFENAWIRAPVAGQTLAAGYCDIVNEGDEDAVVAEFTDASGKRRIEIHETTEQDGMVRMRPLPQLAIAPGQTLSLRPGGKHLMLFGMDGEAPAVDVQARFADGAVATVRFRVNRAMDSRDGT